MFIRMRDSHTRSLAKAVSWRMLGSVDTLVLSFFFTGSIKLAGSIATTLNVGRAMRGFPGNRRSLDASS
jgi:hypothetical protein